MSLSLFLLSLHLSFLPRLFPVCLKPALVSLCCVIKLLFGHWPWNLRWRPHRETSGTWYITSANRGCMWVCVCVCVCAPWSCRLDKQSVHSCDCALIHDGSVGEISLSDDAVHLLNIVCLQVCMCRREPWAFPSLSCVPFVSKTHTHTYPYTLCLIISLCFLWVKNRNVLVNQSLIGAVAQRLHHEVMKGSLSRSPSIWYHWFRVSRSILPGRMVQKSVLRIHSTRVRCDPRPCIYERVLHTPTSYQWQPVLQSPRNEVVIHH